MFECQNDELEKAVLVGIVNRMQTREQVDEYLAELDFLANTAGVEPVKRFVQNVDSPNTRTYVGTGKLEEIKQYIQENEISLVIFDDELQPTQLRNIERELQVKVLDRTNLILDIFAQNARTAHAKAQVELAQYQYLLPRLAGMWTHLERQRGGIGMRGPGETQIEIDRRIVLDKIARLKVDLQKIDKNMVQQRKNRTGIVRVSLVGYTNVGKSTIMNLISKSEVLAQNKLFATLDTTVRKVVINNLPFLLSDTVGFIRKLPTTLIESFKSTLDEVREADLLIHVVDISHANFEEQYEVVEQTINELLQKDHRVEESDPWNDNKPNAGERKYRAKDKKQTVINRPEEIVVFNKIDAFTYTPQAEDDLLPPTRENISLDELQRTWMAKLGETSKAVFISARNKTNIDELREIMYERVKAIHIKRYPYNDFLFQRYDNLEE